MLKNKACFWRQFAVSIERSLGPEDSKNSYGKAMNYGIFEVTILFMDRAPQGPFPLSESVPRRPQVCKKRVKAKKYRHREPAAVTVLYTFERLFMFPFLLHFLYRLLILLV
jgi:hypothetical protein